MLAIWCWPQCVNRGTIVLYFTKHPKQFDCKGAVLSVLEKLLWRQDGCSIRSSHHYRMEFPAPVRYLLHGDDIKWTHFRIAGLLRGEFTGHRWIPRTKASEAELWCFLWSAPAPTDEQTMETPVICDAIVLIMTSLWCHIEMTPIGVNVCVFVHADVMAWKHFPHYWPYRRGTGGFPS